MNLVGTSFFVQRKDDPVLQTLLAFPSLRSGLFLAWEPCAFIPCHWAAHGCLLGKAVLRQTQLLLHSVLSRLKAAAVARLLCHQGSWSPGNSISSSKCLISFIIFHGQSSSPYYLPTFLDHLWISETAWIKVQIGTPLVKLFCCGHWLFGDALCFLALKMFHARECHLFLHSCLVSLGPVLSLTWWKDFGCLIRLYL